MFVLCCLGATYTAQAQRVNTAVEPCKIFGSVFVEKNRPLADYRVYIEPTEGMADLTVFKAVNKLFADKTGLWHITDTKAQADFVIFIESNRGSADFSVYYTETESFAGCK